MGFRIGDSTNVVIACIVSSYGQMEIEMKKLWPSSLLLLQRNDISKVEKPVREYALHDWICQAEVWITNFCKYELFLVHLNPSKHHPLYSTPLYIFNFFASRDAPPPPTNHHQTSDAFDHIFSYMKGAVKPSICHLKKWKVESLPLQLEI